MPSSPSRTCFVAGIEHASERLPVRSAQHDVALRAVFSSARQPEPGAADWPEAFQPRSKPA